MNPDHNAAVCAPQSQNMTEHQPQNTEKPNPAVSDAQTLGKGERSVNVDLFFIPFSEMSSLHTVLAQSWLSDDERTKVARYRAPKAQGKGLQVRAALRAVLSCYADLSPKEWCFEYSAKGKPSLTAQLRQQTGLEFNLSHSGDWLLIGVAQFHGLESALFGVDIERSRPKTDIYPILNHYFSSQETTALLALADEASQRQRFFDLWALKESYIKATGLGLAQSLKSFAFELKPFKQLAAASLQLSCQNAEVRQSCGIAPMLSVYPNISLKSPDTDVLYWQTYFGRLTDEYRFAVSLAHASNVAIAVKLTAQLSSIESLIVSA
ncbi:4'-phosphopantetheinyl transferase family protein [Shewanella glacialipiscicola]|uniref:4'-phosphopantetheinyl transferase n=1 Tax=Shewanella glacialipiscicola TaxID=614069 RepID=A0ABQ6J773_9GAMM|nr:4'-phosphopantetheinyl transferase superfamily protein [Shewanella glacialipiscicola]GIU05596.1 4'-phosphopantetheinyl transferase [Shewanella glacialipiscicola]GMA82772.1 4'-phosphopantetheinyl transferase [Shewanella glacialipiscicola]